MPARATTASYRSVPIGVSDSPGTILLLNEGQEHQLVDRFVRAVRVGAREADEAHPLIAFALERFPAFDADALNRDSGVGVVRHERQELTLSPLKL